MTGKPKMKHKIIHLKIKHYMYTFVQVKHEY